MSELRNSMRKLVYSSSENMIMILLVVVVIIAIENE